DAPAPGLIVCVVDAVHLPIGLRLALEVKRLGLPMVMALNRMDLAKRRRVKIDMARLSSELGVPVVPTVAVRRDGVKALVAELESSGASGQRQVAARWQEPSREDAEQTQADMRGVLAAVGYSPPVENPWFARIDALLLHPLGGTLVLAVVMFLIFQ